MACGTNSSAIQTLSNNPTNTTQFPTPSICAPTSFHPNPHFDVQLNQPQITERSGNLCVQTLSSTVCPYNGFSEVPSNQLVLTSDRTMYSRAEIAQMSSYISEVKQYGWILSSLPQGAEPPPTLQWVLGGSMDSVAASSALDGRAPNPCSMDLELTNIGSTLIQIPKVGVQLEGSPHENTYSYHLINLCSLADCYFGGSGGGCTYDAQIQLGSGNKGTIFSGTPQGIAEGCNALTISPAEQVFLYLDFSVAPGEPQNVVYSFLPIITVDTSQGENIVNLSQMVNTVAYATANQFSCYTLQGTAFTLTTAANDLEGKQYCM